MSNRVIIGCDNQSNVVQFLKDKFTVVTPYVYYKNGDIIKNFDIYLNFDGTLTNTRMMQRHGINQFGHRRMKKFEQMVVARGLDIRTPETFAIVHDDTMGKRNDALYSLIAGEIRDDEQYIIKANDGARGIGQVLITKNEMYKFFDMCASDVVELDTIVERFNIGAKESFMSQSEKEYIRSVINKGDFIIQKRVPMIAEWRYVFFHGEAPMIVGRDVTSKWQANTSVTGKAEIIKYDSSIPAHFDMSIIAERLSKDLNAPWLSIDFYQDLDGNIGVFEYQMQFGYAQMPKDELVRKLQGSVRTWLDYVDHDI